MFRSVTRCTLLGLLLSVLGIPAPAFAQGMGVIYYRSGTATYQVNGDGTGQRLLATTPSELQRPTVRSDYPGGRLFFWNQDVGTIPGTTKRCGNIMVWNPAGDYKPVTAFPGPVYTPTYFTRNLWSNDGQDGFFSFFAYDSTAGLSYVLRAHVSAAQIADPGFQPLVPGDPRLEAVAVWPQFFDCGWDPTGSKLYYNDDRASGGASQYSIRVKVVGVGSTPEDDSILFDPSLTGVRAGYFSVSPSSGQLVVGGSDLKSGRTGLITLDPVTTAWAWLIQGVALGKPGLSGINNPKHSPTVPASSSAPTDSSARRAAGPMSTDSTRCPQTAARRSC